MRASFKSHCCAFPLFDTTISLHKLGLDVSYSFYLLPLSNELPITFVACALYPLRTAGLIKPALYSASVPLWGDRKFLYKISPTPPPPDTKVY